MENKPISSNFNQAAWLTLGSFSSYSLALISAAILSRYFDKAEYGTYKQIIYVYATLQTVFTAGLPGVFAFFIPRLNNGQGKRLINSVNRIFVLLGAIFSLFLFFSSGLLAGLLKNSELEIGLKIFSPFPLFTIPALGVEGIYTALRKTKSIAFYQIATKALMLFCIIFPVIIFKGSYRSAIVGWGLGSLITFMIAMIMKNRPFVKIKEELVPNMYKSIFNYSLPLMGASIVGMILRSADQFFISRYYGEVIFAEFSNGYIPLPFVGMITGSVASVLLPLLSKAESEGNMGEAFNSYNRAVVKSIYLLYPLIFFCLFFARDIMVFIYGAPYEISKSYFRVSLIKSVISVFPYLSVILAFGKSNVYFFVHLIFAIIIWLVDFILVKLLLPPIAIALSSSLVDVFMAISILGYIRIKHNVILAPFSLIKHMFIIGMHVSIIAGMLYCLRIIYIPTLNSLVVLFISGITFYVILILTGKIIKIDYVSEIITRFHTIIKYEK